MNLRKCSLVAVVSMAWILAEGRPAAAQTASAPAVRPANAVIRPMVIGPDLNGENIQAFVGQEIIVSLPANPTTGYQWTMTALDGNCLQQTAGLTYQPFAAPRPNMVGASGFTTATFNAVKVGQTTIRLHYARSWQAEDPLAKNFMVALTVLADPTEKRVVILKNNLGTFNLMLNYVGESDKPFYRLLLTTQPLAPVKQPDSFLLRAEITRDQADKLVDLLARGGFFRRATDSKDNKILNIYLPESGAYTMTVRGGMAEAPVQYFHSLGFDAATLFYMEKMRETLKADGADRAVEQFNQLIARLEGYRKQWQAEGQPAPASQPAQPQ